MNLSPFIRGYTINTDLCDRLVAASERIEFTSGPKAYTHCMLDQFDQDLRDSYVHALFAAVEQYKAEFPWCYREINRWGLYPLIKLQRYSPGHYYAEWHCENGGNMHGDNLLRHLVFMTYLTDCEVGGGTEFLYQDLQVQPQKGLTLIWPADWTHHQGYSCSHSDQVDRYRVVYLCSLVSLYKYTYKELELDYWRTLWPEY